MSDSNQDQPNLPDDLGPDGASSGSAGNRPADGARHASPDEVLSTGFEGSENAGDFLGLDLEFTGAADAAPEAPAPAPVAEPELELSSPVSVAPTDGETTDYDAEYDLDSPTQIMHADEEVFGDEEEYDPAEGEDEFGEAFDDELEHVASGGRGKMIGMALVVGALAFGGVFVGPKLLSKFQAKTGQGVQIAKTPDATIPTLDLATETTGADTSEATDTSISTPDTIVAESGDGSTVPTDAALTEAADTEAADVTPDTTSPDLATVLATATSGDPVNTDGGNAVQAFDSSPIDVLLGNEPDSSSASMVDPSVAASVGMAAAEFPEFDAGYEWVSSDLLDMVWRGNFVPMEAVSAPARTLMPRVGHVRVFMSSGESIDGRLYAVGQRRVWLDIGPGRVGLDGDSVERFEHLAVESSPTGEPMNTQQAPLAGRVSVEVPGGHLFGRILSRGDGVVTLLCDDDARVTIRNPVIKSITDDRAILVQR